MIIKMESDRFLKLTVEIGSTPLFRLLEHGINLSNLDKSINIHTVEF